jgi:hypothetical protein
MPKVCPLWRVCQTGTGGDVDLELVAVIQAWAELPESVKDAVSALLLRSPGEAARPPLRINERTLTSGGSWMCPE